MKKKIKIHIVLAFALLSVVKSVYAFTDPLDKPSEMSPLAEHGLLNGVTTAGDRLVAVGQRGHIIYSDDFGSSWEQAQVPVSSDLTAIHFILPEIGWAVGHDGVILKSVDAGSTWKKQLDGRDFPQIFSGFSIPEELQMDSFLSESLHMAAERLGEQGAENPFLAVWFESENVGYVAGAFNLILRTDDGGESWSPYIAYTDNPDELHIYSMNTMGGVEYITGERGLVMKGNKESGRFEDASVDYLGTLFGSVGNDDVQLVFGLRGNLFRSNDQGESWTKVGIDSRESITGAAVLNDGSFVLVANGGSVWRSDRHASKFTPVELDQKISATGISVVGNDVVAIVGGRGKVVQPLNGQQ